MEMKKIIILPLNNQAQYLKRNLEINNIPKVTALNIGISNTIGKIIFSVSEEHSGASFIADQTRDTNTQLVECAVTTIDEYIAHGGITPDFIKCDVEGAELMAFKGAINLLSNHPPIVFTEMLRKWAQKFSYHPNEIIQYFDELNYACFVIRNDKLANFKTVTDETTDTNYLFLHRLKHNKLIQEFSAHQ